MTPPNLPGIGDSKPNKLKPTTNSKIKSIEIDEHGQPVIQTSKGKKKLLSCRLVKLHPGSKTPKQILMEKRK